jgi:hypothetical protein
VNGTAAATMPTKTGAFYMTNIVRHIIAGMTGTGCYAPWFPLVCLLSAVTSLSHLASIVIGTALLINELER